MCGKGWVVKGYSAFSEDSTVLKGYAERGVVVLLQWLWEWKGSVQREGQERQVISVLFKGCRNGEGRCNGRGEQGKDALACVP